MIDLRTDRPRSVDTLVLSRGDDGLRLDGVSADLIPADVRRSAEAYVAETSDGTSSVLPRPGQHPSRLVVVDIGAGSPNELRRAGGWVARQPDLGRFTFVPPDHDGLGIAALVEGLILGDYRFAVGERPPRRTGWLPGAPDSAVQSGRSRADAVVWARDLANTRTSTKTPAWLGRAAQRELTPLGVDVTVRDVAELTAAGFGGVLAVGAGSASPPRLIEARWTPRGARAHLVIVGKGITFDTGGINLKAADGMANMYTDMAGGAAALGALRAVASQRVKVRMTVLVPAAENSISGTAMRPSDVIRQYGGRTTEIRNTDAEGRLVLADALAYAVDRLRPTALVDIATLTGAMKVGLGLRTAGLFASSDDLSMRLLAAGEAADEPLWRMPLIDDYLPQLDSDLADANNSPGSPGAVTAALFLRPFVGDVPWAHLDIAGPARAPADDGWLAKGATGFGTGLLARWAESYAA